MSLDKYLSEIVSPFDETETDQVDVTINQYNRYKRDVLIQSIAKKNGNQYFDLFFDEYIDHLKEEGNLKLFLGECLGKLNEVYNLNCVSDYIDREEIIINDQESIISFIKFFVYDDWYIIADLLKPIDPSMVTDRLSLATHVKESYSEIKNKLMIKNDIHPLFLFQLENCAVVDGIKTLTIMLFKDTVGIIIRQMGVT